MGILELFITACVPVFNMLLLTGVGSFLASDFAGILGKDARKHLNNIVFYVFNPSLVSIYLAKTITMESFGKLWFMPVNILLVFVFGLLLGWIVIRITGAPAKLRGLALGCCSAGAIPFVTLIMGANLLNGVRGEASVQPSIIVAVIVVRYILLPLLGTGLVKGAVRLGLIQPDPLYQFVLLLQYAVPPAMNIGTIMQLFGVGESECSVIFVWAYALARRRHRHRLVRLLHVDAIVVMSFAAAAQRRS